MNKPFSDAAYPLINRALDLKRRLDAGESPDLDTEHRRMLELLRADGEARRLGDYAGDGGVFLGARYALACWVDELFILHTQPPWSTSWTGRVLEFELFGTRDRAFKFWDQLRVALKRPNAPRPSVAPGPDALEAFYLCIVLGFRGELREKPAEVKAYVEEIRPQFGSAAPWKSPRDQGVTTNVEPLTGRQDLLRVMWVRGLALAGAVLAALALWILFRAKAKG